MARYSVGTGSETVVVEAARVEVASERNQVTFYNENDEPVAVFTGYSNFYLLPDDKD